MAANYYTTTGGAWIITGNGSYIQVSNQPIKINPSEPEVEFENSPELDDFINSFACSHNEDEAA
jgi:hypothetical protein